MNESQIPIVSMNLRTPANIKSLKNTAVPQELIEGEHTVFRLYHSSTLVLFRY